MNKSFLYFVIGILVAVIIWLSTCNKPKPVVVVDTKYKDSLQWARDTIATNRAFESVQQETIAAAETHILELGDRGDEALSKLAKANKEVNYWISKLNVPVVHDSGVNYNLTDPCDSLALAAKKAQTECTNVIQIKDSTIDWYKGEVGSYKLITQSLIHDTTLYAGQVSILEHVVSKLEKQAIVRRKIYGGIEGYSTQKAFQSLQVGLLYADKKGNIFGGSGGLFLDGSPVFGLKYYKLIQLKKH